MSEVQFSTPFRKPNPPEQDRDQPGRPCRKGQPAEVEEWRGIHIALLDMMEHELKQWHRLDDEERGKWVDWIMSPIPWGGAYREPDADLLERIMSLGAEMAANPFRRKVRAERRFEIQSLLEKAGCLVPGSFAVCCLAAGLDPEIMQSSLRRQIIDLIMSDYSSDCSAA